MSNKFKIKQKVIKKTVSMCEMTVSILKIQGSQWIQLTEMQSCYSYVV